MGVEEFDSRDRPLVWRTTGGKTRRLLGGADAYASDSIESFRDVALGLIDKVPAFDLATMEREQARLLRRVEQFGQCHDTPEIWRKMNIPEAKNLSDLSDEDFTRVVQTQPDATHDAR
jgi:malonate decarboxylase beta subunit